MVNKAATHAELYEQRRAHHRGDESKRRKFLRWMQKTLGVSDDPREEEYHTSQTAMSHHSHHSNHEQYFDNNSNQMEPRNMSGSISSSHSSSFDYEPGVPVYYVGSNPQKSTPGDSFHNTMSSMASTASVSSAASVDASSIYDFHHRMPRQHQIPRDRFQRPNNQPHVLIIGGGIGGLTLAQGLKKNGIPFTVFERDPTPNYRTQGYRLRINGAGYEALKANLTRDNFEVFLRSTGHFLPGFSYIDAETGGGAPAGVKFAHRSSTTRHVFSTDRAMLRSLLLSDLAAGTEVQFGMAFKRYQVLPNGRVEVHFENGTIAEGSVLVGADGTTSRVRRQYIPRNVTLLDTDTGAIYGKTPITPDIEQYFATGTTTMITSQHPKMALVIEPRCATKINLRDYITATGGMANPANTELEDLHNYLCWVLLARADVFHTREDMTVHDLYAMAPEEVADLSVQITSNWCPRIRALLEQQDPEWASFLRISTMSPDIKPWQPSMVTLLGDAVHTMTPAGIGCNTAMQDAMMLVQQFREVGVNVEAIARYEGAMRHHGRDGINTSIDAGKRMFGLPDVEDMRVVSY